MSVWRQLARGWRVLVNQSAADAELADETDHYLEQAASAWQEKGLSPEAARRAARLEVGNLAAVRDQVRAANWENAVGTALADLRYAIRRLRNDKAFALLGGVTLALGIGASTAIFSAVRPLLIDPLPYPRPRQILTIWYAGSDGSRALQTFGTFRELAARSQTLEAIAAFTAWQPTITGSDEPERIDGQLVTSRYFEVLGIAPAIGARFADADDRPAGAKVAIISHSLWQRRFGGDRTIVGRQFTLDETLYTVVGVMPPGFEDVLSPTADIWSLLQYPAPTGFEGREWGHNLRTIGRIHPGLGLEDTRRDLDRVARAQTRDFPRPPWASLKNGLIVGALADDVSRQIKPALFAVIGAVALVLVIACVNVTSLLVGRGSRRRTEFAMRAALGAGRGRLLRQLLTENVLLAVLGGTLGLMVAEAGVRLLVALSPPGLPRAQAIAIDGQTFLFASIVTLTVGALVGLLPAAHAWRSDLNSALQHAPRQMAGGRRLTRAALVTGEVALAAILLTGAGLLLRSLDRLFASSPGFDRGNLLTMQVQVATPKRIRGTAAYHAFYERALDAVRRVPTVANAAFTSELPFSGENPTLDEYCGSIEGYADGPGPCAFRYAVTPDYFQAMRIPLVRGRRLEDSDVAGATGAVVVSESFARRVFGAADPIGRRVRYGGLATRPWDVIVGVVGDVKESSLAGDKGSAFYLPMAQSWVDNPMWLVVRARGDAAALVPAAKAAVWSIDKDQPVARVATMAHLLDVSEAQRRFALIVFECFALVALALAAIGIYGVLSGSVTERTREIGVRSALGASRRDIVSPIARQGVTLAMIGAGMGLAGATAASRAIDTLLYGVSRLDATTYAAVVALLLVVSAVACWLPAWRAARIDPAVTLRAE